MLTRLAMIRVVGGEGDWMEAAAHSGGGGAPDEQIFSQILPRRIGAGFRPCHLGFWTGPTQLMPISVDDRYGRGRKLPYTHVGWCGSLPVRVRSLSPVALGQVNSASSIAASASSFPEQRESRTM